jgi:hypothetical protein
MGSLAVDVDNFFGHGMKGESVSFTSMLPKKYAKTSIPAHLYYILSNIFGGLYPEPPMNKKKGEKVSKGNGIVENGDALGEKV